MVFALRQLQEKCIEQRQDLYLFFIDLTKAFDTASRPGLWSILSKLGCPPKFVRAVRSFHDSMMARVIENGDVSEPFPVTNGRSGNLQPLKTHTKMHEALVRDFLFVDDCALAAHSEEDLQCLADCFSAAAKAFGLTISIKKTEELYQAAPGASRPKPVIRIDGTPLKNVEDLTYLGNLLVWLERGITQGTKVAVYKAVVLSSLLYSCETWNCYRRHVKKLNQFHLRCLHKLLGIHWEDCVTNQEVLCRAALPGIEALIIQAQLRWPGHVMRMEDSRLPKSSSALSWPEAQGKREARSSATKTPSSSPCGPATSPS
ncbi:uncharacterized protein LOC134767494 [Penaeus indicus]|uniref:uncharacterized protein LOC134767494 n=1 Tax=Penaeus indicus TaxID=29960 RepID=UPI00300D7ED1